MKQSSRSSRMHRVLFLWCAIWVVLLIGVFLVD